MRPAKQNCPKLDLIQAGNLNCTNELSTENCKLFLH